MSTKITPSLKLAFTTVSLALLAASGSVSVAAPLGTAFTYQGRLDWNGQPVNGPVVMGFAVFDAPAPGGSLVSPTNLWSVDVVNGLFAVDLDFGAVVFAGEARWLEIRVSTNNAQSFTTLLPRTRLAPTPHAVYASTAGTVTNGAIQISQLGTLAPPASGQVLTYNGAALAWANPAAASGAWVTGGNSILAGNFLGSLNNLPLVLKANNVRVQQFEPNATSPNLVGGWNGNIVDAGVSGATIAGGGAALQFSQSASNRITDNFGTIGGGAHNLAGNTNGNFTDAYYATVGGGHLNAAVGVASTIAGGAENRSANNSTTIGGGYLNHASGYIATIAGGVLNTNRGDYGALGGGYQNAVQLNGDTVGGGYFNIARGSSSTVGGGYQNTAGGGAATVAGGSHNAASNSGTAVGGGEQNLASAEYSAVVGGYGNLANGYGAAVSGGVGNTASGYEASVPGGLNNLAAADLSFAAGANAQALHTGSFVWADSQSTPPPIPTGIPFASVANDEFAVRARGGARFQTGFLQVSGLGNEKAYLGGDGVGGEVHLGSFNPATTRVALYNMAASQYMHLDMKSCTIYGGADVAEPFQMSTPELASGSVVVIDKDHPGKLKASTTAYDKRVAGIVSGANGVSAGIALHQQGVLEGGQNVALSGRVYVLADATHGEIEPGDLLTTSDLPGHAMKASDPTRAQGAILGKAMSSLKEGTGLVLVLVTLQ